MDEMITYLENRGYKATKKYMPEKERYIFTIRWENSFAEAEFKYPATVDAITKDAIQRKFLRHLIDLVNKQHALDNRKDNNNFVMELAMTNEPVTLAYGDKRIPVKVSEINHDHAYGEMSNITIKCEVVNTMDVASLYPNSQSCVKMALNSIYGAHAFDKNGYGIEKVIFNDPATIVFWTDGTKTVVKTQDGEPFDREKGLSMAISKKVLGNKHDYYHVFKKWVYKKNK